MKNNFLFILSVLLMICALYFAVFTTLFDSVKVISTSDVTVYANILRYSSIILALVIIGFIICIFLNVNNKKSPILFTLILLVVLTEYTFSKLQSFYLLNSNINVESTTVISILLSALLYVCLVFSSKNKIWACIIAIILIAFKIYQVGILVDCFSICLQNVNQSSNIDSLSSSYFVYYLNGSLLVLTIYCSIMIYFIRKYIILIDSKRVIEENKQDETNDLSK